MYVSTSCLKPVSGRYHEDLCYVLKVYSELGFGGVELGAAHKRASSLKAVLDYDFDYTVHNIFPPPKEGIMLNFASTTHIREESVAIAKETLEWCRRLDASIYTTHAGFLADIKPGLKQLSPFISVEEALSNMINSIREVCDSAEQMGIRVALENMAPESEILHHFSAADLRKVLDEVKSKQLGLLIDLGHLGLAGRYLGVDPAREIRELSGHIVAFHVNEVVGPDHHMPLRDTTIFRRFGVSRELLGRTSAILEVHNMDREQVKKNAELLRQSMGQ
jgi:sugar phosphate isomerase/epimerase